MVGVNVFRHLPVNTHNGGKAITKDVPAARSGHRIVFFDGNLYAIGGYNTDYWGVQNTDDTIYPLFKELWKFNLTTLKWHKLKTAGMPSELASHSAVIYGSVMIVFGGTGIPFGDTATNSVHACHLKTLQWKEVHCNGDKPIRTYGHAAIVAEDKMFVHGGTTGWEYNSETHQLDLRTLTWEALHTESGQGDQPLGRYRHETGYFEKKLYIFGGGTSQNCYSFEKVPVFDTESRKWSEQSTFPDTTDGFPVPRRCHSSIQLESDVYICGGYNGISIFGDLWKCSLINFTWIRYHTELPQPVYFHSAAVSLEGLMVIFGGVTCIDKIRSSQVYSIWLKVPPLKELSWKKVLDKILQLKCIDYSNLREIGVPEKFIDRLR